MNRCLERLYNGIIKESPTVVLMLGMCPTLAVTSGAIAGFGMGATTTIVLMMSNTIISLLRRIIPDRVRMPAYIVIVATLVTVIQFLLKGFIPSLDDTLGVYIPLIVVNCIILGRAEAYASKNPVLPSFFDGMGMGIGFTISLTILGLLREIIGAGSVFGIQIIKGSVIEPIAIFTLAPGGFLVLGVLTALRSHVIDNMKKEGREITVPSGEDISCVGCDGCSTKTCNCTDIKSSEQYCDKEVRRDNNIMDADNNCNKKVTVANNSADVDTDKSRRNIDSNN